MSAATLTDRQYLRLEVLKLFQWENLAYIGDPPGGTMELRIAAIEAFILAASEEDGPAIGSPFGELRDVSHFGTPEGERHFRGECGLVILREGG